MLSVALLVLTGLVGFRTYNLWQKGPWELPGPGEERGVVAVVPNPGQVQRPLLPSTKNILDMNLFDPERGQGRNGDGDALSSAVQKIRRMVLLGTAIIGDSRYAILQEAAEPRKAPAPQANQIRLKLGDAVEGFKVAEIQDRRVVFARGATKVEVSLDFMRKADDGGARVGAPAPVAPRVPNPIPRRLPGARPDRSRNRE